MFRIAENKDARKENVQNVRKYRFRSSESKASRKANVQDFTKNGFREGKLGEFQNISIPGRKSYTQKIKEMFRSFSK